MRKGAQKGIADNWDRASLSQRAWMICRAISDETMDQEKIKRLLEVADQQDQIKLKVLHNAVVKCIKDYQTESTSARLNDWQKAETALETFVKDLWSKHFEDEKILPNALAVVEWLNDQGWKVRKSALYKHRKEGKIRPQADGTFRLVDVEKYAAVHLSRKDGSESGKLDKLQQERVLAETEKSKAQAKHWTTKERILSRSFVPKDLFERELTKRAIIFRNDLEAFGQSEAAGIVNLVKGDPDLVPELIQYLLGKFEDVMDRYAREREFKVLLPPQETDLDMTRDEDDEEEGV